MDLNRIGNAALTVVNDPFKKNKITKVQIEYGPKLFDNNVWEAKGYIWFTNGATSGSQKFEGKSFDGVVLEMKNFINGLE